MREAITSLWNSKLQDSGWKIHNVLLPNQDCPPHLTIQKTCCCQGTDFAVLLHHGRGEKLVGALKKTLLGNGGGCSSFLSFWLGFYSVKYKEKYVSCFPYQNLHSVCSHAKCCSGLQCQRSPGNTHSAAMASEGECI